MAKRQVHEEHENHERWLVSYADFITLLFAFFVVMYSVSRVDQVRMVQVVHAIKFAMHFKGSGGVGELPLFDGPPSEGGCIANVGSGQKMDPVPEAKRDAEKLRKKLRKRLSAFLLHRPDFTNSVNVEVDGVRLLVRLSAARFFDPDQAAIRPEMIPVLDVIAEEMAQARLPLRVEGHTDKTPSSNPRFRDNWELSSSRASSVVSYLETAHAIPGQFLAAAGLGATRPVAENNTPEGREANRRIEIVVDVGGKKLGILGR